eukprot:403348028
MGLSNASGNKECYPAFGVLSQPVSKANLAGFQNDQYILDVNREFIELGGSCAIPINYDISREELLQLLPSLNGVLFTGGGLDLIDPVTQAQHPYYKTAKIIYDYAIQQKDSQRQQQTQQNTDQGEFILMGVCQGYQLLSMLAAGDIYTLERIPALNVNRKTNWTVHPTNQSRMFKTLTEEIIKGYEQQELAFHFHNFGISTSRFQSLPNLSNFFNVLQTDNLNGLDYVVAIEAKEYPIYGVLYHPEYQMLDHKQPFSNNRNLLTMKIAQHFSTFMNKEATKSKRILSSSKLSELFALQSLSRLQPLQYNLGANQMISAIGLNSAIAKSFYVKVDSQAWTDGLVTPTINLTEISIASATQTTKIQAQDQITQAHGLPVIKPLIQQLSQIQLLEDNHSSAASTDSRNSGANDCGLESTWIKHGLQQDIVQLDLVKSLSTSSSDTSSTLSGNSSPTDSAQSNQFTSEIAHENLGIKGLAIAMLRMIPMETFGSI